MPLQEISQINNNANKIYSLYLYKYITARKTACIKSKFKKQKNGQPNFNNDGALNLDEKNYA